MSDAAAVNTDREIWRGPDTGGGAFYADSIHVTADGGIGINCGGTVIVKPLREWHKLALSLHEGRSFPNIAREFDLMSKGCRALGLESQEGDWDSWRQDAEAGKLDPETIIEAIDYDYRNDQGGRGAATVLIGALVKDLLALAAPRPIIAEERGS